VMTIVIAISSLTARWFDWSHCELTSYWNHIEPGLCMSVLASSPLSTRGARRQGLLKVRKRRNTPCHINPYG
jgi:hypothetical protein